MKYLNKKMTTIIAVILLISSLTLIANIPAAHAELQVNTTAYMSFRPNPVGVGQTILVNVWLVPAIHVSRNQSGYMVTITKPDGTKDPVGPLESYPGDSTAWFEYVVDQVGTWKLKFDYPGKHFPSANVSVAAVGLTGYNLIDDAYYLPSSTEEQTLIVQEEQVMSWPPSPLPNDYWTRPVSPENREWAPIVGNYPWTGHGGGANWPAETNTYSANYKFTPYVQAPNTPHIAWKHQDAISGIIGEDLGFQSLTSAGGNPSVIYAGRGYQSFTMPGGTSALRCYDIRTGEVFWELPGLTAPTAISYYSSGTSTSVSLIALSSGRLMRYDPWTGAVSLNMTLPVTSAIFYNDPYALSVQTINATLKQYRLINLTTAGAQTVSFAQRIISNISFALPSIRQADYEAGIAFYSSFEPTPLGAWYGFNMSAASLKTGELLWSQVISGETDSLYSPTCTVCDHGKVAMCMMDRYWACYDLATGKLLWRSELADYPWGFGWAYAVESAYGLLYGQSYAGVYAFDWDTGKIVWQYNTGNAGYETPYETWSFNGGAVIADGKLYAHNTEHTPTQPITRGWRLNCINATTGEGIWNITGSMSPGAVADGYLTAGNSYDGYMYVFGKGKSGTTVSAPQTAITQGQSIVLTGSVLDQSPAQAGAACVSKESMATYMEYLHMQKPIPSNVTIIGVPVSLDAVDPNGNAIHIATVTSDMSGTFSYLWTPDVPGKYTITATFMGDDSYGSSWAETAVGVVQAPAASPTATPPQITMPPTEMYFTGSTIAIIIAIAIVGALMLRKRP